MWKPHTCDLLHKGNICRKDNCWNYFFISHLFIYTIISSSVQFCIKTTIELKLILLFIKWNKILFLLGNEANVILARFTSKWKKTKLFALHARAHAQYYKADIKGRMSSPGSYGSARRCLAPNAEICLAACSWHERTKRWLMMCFSPWKAAQTAATHKDSGATGSFWPRPSKCLTSVQNKWGRVWSLPQKTSAWNTKTWDKNMDAWRIYVGIIMFQRLLAYVSMPKLSKL